jgi:peptidoglycan/xylan/chitin deacetylase (PgdA/CDA1 family)
MKLLVLTYNLHSLTDYSLRYALPLKAEDPHFFYRAPLDRWLALCRAQDWTSTFFVVAHDVSGFAKERLKELLACQYELASHSNQHDLNLSALDAGAILKDLRLAKATLQEELGCTPTGFRAPGWVMNQALMSEIKSLGFLYDSSILPTRPEGPFHTIERLYHHLKGYPRPARPNQSFFAPLTPYRVGEDPYEEGRGKVIELPVSVDQQRTLAATQHGLLMASRKQRDRLLQDLKQRETVIVSFDALTFVNELKDPIPAGWRGKIPELRIPFDERQSLLAESLEEIARARRVVTAHDLAQHHQSLLA